MVKFNVFALILLTAIFMAGPAHCQQALNHPVKIVTGYVDRMDAEGGIMEVRTHHGDMVFSISSETQIHRAAHHMSAIEIEKGDPVVIQYFTSSGRNYIVNLVDNQ